MFGLVSENVDDRDVTGLSNPCCDMRRERVTLYPEAPDTRDADGMKLGS